MDSIVNWILFSPINAWVVYSPWILPVSNVLHFMGMSMLLGSMLLIDLRLAGFWRAISLAAVQRLLPWAIAGFGINLLTGTLFFFGDPERYVANVGFMLKMVLLLIAGLNAAWFKVRIIPGLADQAAEQDATTEAKIVAWLSLLSWFGVLLLGRLIAYLGPG